MSGFKISVPEASVDPNADAQEVQIYAKSVGGVTQFFARASDGTITQLTPAGTGLSTADSMFGDGSDGNVTIAVDTTLTRDMYYNNLTINVGVKLLPDGYRIFVRHTLTLNGNIVVDGNDGSTAPDTPSGSGGAGGGTQPVSGARVLGLSTNLLSINGGNGGAQGGGGAGPGGDSPNAPLGFVAGSVTNAAGGIGQGGAGGQSAGNVNGGSSGANTIVASPQGNYPANIPQALVLRNSQLNISFTPGTGGGGGRGGDGAGTGGGGGGGASGGLIVVAANLVAVPPCQGAGGGGGGGGIAVVIIGTGSFPTVDVSGGAGGLPGQSGGTGHPGFAGGTGLAILLGP
jgi:hypothetical protein